jgi:4-hydroxythreonine-4-phosphate dehydrogenase
LIIADDLSGAADAAAACAGKGLSAVTALDGDGADPATDVLAVDLETRGMPVEAAQSAAARLTERFAAGRRSILFKKVDSTLRGHIVAEIAAILTTLRQRSPGRALAILAPAFPRLGRTTVDGRQRLHGRPLEESEIWQREQFGTSASLIERIADRGLAAGLIPLAGIRRGEDAIGAAMQDFSGRCDVVVCDAEVESDLAAIARAALRLTGPVVWVGSAGLAGHLAAALLPLKRDGSMPLPPGARRADAPFLFVVGSPSLTSRRQAARLVSEDVTELMVGPPRLEDEAEYRAVGESMDLVLGRGRDVLVRTTDDGLDAADARRLNAALSALCAPRLDRIGGLFVTGGETARSLLDGMQVPALRHVAEVEPGVPLTMAMGGRSIPFITKAVAFGDDETMLRCRKMLRDLPLSPRQTTAFASRRTESCHFR